MRVELEQPVVDTNRWWQQENQAEPPVRKKLAKTPNINHL